MKPCFVYIIATLHTDDEGLVKPVKIGVTANPKARLGNLQCGSIYLLRFAAMFKLPSKRLAHDVERIIKDAYWDENFIGEWYALDPSKAALSVQRAIVELRRYIVFNLYHATRNAA